MARWKVLGPPPSPEAPPELQELARGAWQQWVLEDLIKPEGFTKQSPVAGRRMYYERVRSSLGNLLRRIEAAGYVVQVGVGGPDRSWSYRVVCPEASPHGQ